MRPALKLMGARSRIRLCSGKELETQEMQRLPNRNRPYSLCLPPVLIHLCPNYHPLLIALFLILLHPLLHLWVLPRIRAQLNLSRHRSLFPYSCAAVRPRNECPHGTIGG
eukprot:9471009-Pyramimonas_sp.AAC.5